MIRSIRNLALHACLLIAFLSVAAPARAHGYAGPRFFPATLATDDPFVSDELSLPTVEMSTDSGSPLSRETDVSIDVSKRITRNFGIGFGEAWSHVSAKGASSVDGFQNLELGAKYLALENDTHEFLLSLGVDASVGRTGDERVGADDFTVITPGVFIGKGLGDLPPTLGWLRPFALTGAFGVDLPTTPASPDGGGGYDRHPHVLSTGLAIEYSLPYLEAQVHDLRFSAPFTHLIPLVEISLETPLDRGEHLTTGTVNPGLIWVGRYFQIGAEATLPVNSASAHGVGAILQLHFFLDDIFPRSLGKPVFGP